MAGPWGSSCTCGERGRPRVLQQRGTARVLQQRGTPRVLQQRGTARVRPHICQCPLRTGGLCPLNQRLRKHEFRCKSPGGLELEAGGGQSPPARACRAAKRAGGTAQAPAVAGLSRGWEGLEEADQATLRAPWGQGLRTCPDIPSGRYTAPLGWSLERRRRQGARQGAGQGPAAF